jgi:hypothetical protein
MLFYNYNSNNIKNKYMSFLNSLKSLLGMSVEVEQAPIVEAAPEAAPEPMVEAPVAAPVMEAPVAAPEPMQAVENVMNDPMVAPHVEEAPQAPIDTALDTNIEIMEPAATTTENA